jgi:glycerate-2-kinase
MNINTIYLGSSFEGLAVDHGKYLAHLADQFSSNCLPSAFVLGGETVVKLEDTYQNSIGGRNQEAALSSGISFKHKKNMDISICCLGTDGIDGNSKNAGAVVTSRVFPMISSNRQKYEGFLTRHDSSNAFRELDTLIITGRTGTNVNDISIIVRVK